MVNKGEIIDLIAANGPLARPAALVRDLLLADNAESPRDAAATFIAEICIVSGANLLPFAEVGGVQPRAAAIGVPMKDGFEASNDAPGLWLRIVPAPGSKCDRCWRVLPEVGASAAHPTLCRRCETVVSRTG